MALIQVNPISRALRPTAKPRMLALEQRMLFDGAAVAAAAPDVDSVGPRESQSVKDVMEATKTPAAFDLRDTRGVFALAPAVSDLSGVADQADALIRDYLASASDAQLFAFFNGGRTAPDAEWLGRLAQLRADIDSGRFQVQVLEMDSASRFTAIAAFAPQGPGGAPTIFINRTWFDMFDAPDANRTLVEEIGHGMDAYLNAGADTPGDEGERFAAQVMKNEVDEASAISILTERDAGSVVVAGASYDVEFAAFNFTNAYEMLRDLDGDGVVDNTENWSEKEQETHTIIIDQTAGATTYTGGLGAVRITDGTNGQSFSGNDVSVTATIGGVDYHGWISRPMKIGGVVKGFYFWRDTGFGTLSAAQADGNQDGDSSVLDNRGYILVVDQSYFTGLTKSAVTVSAGAETGTYQTVTVKSSSDRVDSALNGLVTANAAPVANNDSATGTPNAAQSTGQGTAALEQGYNTNTSTEITATINASGSVLANDTDANSDALSVTNFSSKSTGAAATATSGGTALVGRYGTLTMKSDGQWSYVVNNSNTTVNALLSGNISEQFSYTASDGKGGTATATLTVQINGSNDAPVANSDYNTAKESTTTAGSGFNYTGYSASGNVLTNDTDVDSGDTKAIAGLTLSGSTTVGGITVNQGSYVLTFTSTGGNKISSLTANNTATADEFYISLNGQTGTGIVYYGVYDASNVLIYAKAKVSNAGGGYDVTLSGTPSKYWNGTSYTSISDVPVFFDTFKDVLFDNSAAQTITGANNSVIATLSSGISNGTTTLSTLSSISGTIAVGMSVSGTGVPSGTKVSELTYTGGVLTSITLDRELTSTAPVTLTFSKTGALTSALQGAHGSLSLNSDGSYTYTPTTDNAYLSSGQSAIEVFDYTMQDTAGAQSSSKLYITVYGTGTNDPTLVSDTGAAKEFGVQNGGNTVESGSSATGTLLSNDTTGAGGVVASYSVGTGNGTGTSPTTSLAGSYGSISIATNGSYTYTVDNTNATVDALAYGESLTDTFIYRVTNTAGGSSIAKLVVTIAGTNDAPVAVNDSGGTLTEDATVTKSGSVLSNDTDVDTSDTYTVTKAGLTTASTAVSASTTSASGLTVSGTYGNLVIGADGTYLYTLGVTTDQNTAVQALANAASVSEVFNYEITDARGAKATATLTFTVTGASDPPVNKINGASFSDTARTTYTTSASTALVFSGDKQLSVSDLDNDLASVTLTVANGTLDFTGAATATVSASSGATITISGTQAAINATLALLRYTPTTGFTGTDYLTIASKDSTNQWDSDGIAISIPTAFTGPAVKESDLSTGSSPSGNGEEGSTSLTAPSGQNFGTAQQSGTDTYGTWTLTTGGLFTYTLTSAPSVTGASTTRSIEITTYDDYGNATTNTVTVTINNDAPTANADARSVTEGTTASPAANLTGNVLASGGSGDAADTTGADTPVTVTHVIKGSASPTTTVASGSTSTSSGTSVAGNYGTLVIGANGSYTYDLDDANATVEALNAGDSLTETFTYQITDSDGSTSTATLTFTINGTTDAPPTATVSSPTVNEASPYAVFTVTASQNQNLTLALANGTATGGGTDYGPTLEYSLDGGTTWTTYTGAFNNTLTGTGLTTGLLVRTPINNDGTPDNNETFTLTATPTGGTAAVGTATIKDDGTGTIFKDDGTENTTAAKNNDVTVSSPTVNEASPYAVFTVTATEGQNLSLALGDGTANGSGTDYGPSLQYSLDGGITWTTYTGAFNNDLTGSGLTTGLLVRTPINNDGTPDNNETFTLTATPTGGAAAVGTATIKDDGTGTIFKDDGTENTTAAKNNDVTVSSPTVNEASPYVVFTVTATQNQNLSLALGDVTANGSGTDYGSTTAPNLQYSLDGGTTWTTYTGAFNNTLTGSGLTTGLLVRTPITNDTALDNNETFTLTATPTGGTNAVGTATIKDDGTGTIFNNDGTENTTAEKNNDSPPLIIPKDPPVPLATAPIAPAPVIVVGPAGPSQAAPPPIIRVAEPGRPLLEVSFPQITVATVGRFTPEQADAGLFVLNPIRDQVTAGGNVNLQLPPDMFAHTDPAAKVSVEAFRVSGSGVEAIPQWLRFDATTGKVSGQFPAGVREVEIMIQAIDQDGRKAVVQFKIRAGEGGAPEVRGKLSLDAQIRLALEKIKRSAKLPA